MSFEYRNLYSVGEDHSIRGGSMRATPEPSVMDAKIGLLRGTFRPRRAIRFDRHSGKRICDVIWTTFAGVPLISKQFRDLLRKNGFTGWSTYPVAVYGAEEKRIRDYFGFSITGRAGVIDKSRAKKVLRPPYVEGGPKIPCYVGLFFKDDQWDGSDFVIPDKSAYKIVTSRVKDALQALNIPNVEFEPLDTYERPIS